MKKLLSTLLVIAMVVACIGMFTACDKPDAGTDGGNEGGTKVPNANPNFKIGVLHINSVTDKSGYTFAHQQGIKYMQEQLGFTDDQIKIKDRLVDTDPTAVSTAIEELISAGCNMIIGTSFGYMDPMLAAAQANPDVIFSHGTGFKSNFDNTFIGADKTPNKNMNNYFGRIYQARYLSGIVAGLKAKAINNPKLGYIAAFGTEIAECSSGINAFTLGAQAVYPEAEVHVKKLGTWYDPANETAYAEALLNLGCGVITQHCDTQNPSNAAKKAGKFSVGYNSDMRHAINDESVLTSVVWNWGVYYKAAVEAALKCFDEDAEFVSTKAWEEFGNYYEGYDKDLFGLAELSSQIAPDTAEILSLVEAKMKAGRTEWDVFNNKKALDIKKVDGKWTVSVVDKDLQVTKVKEALDKDGKTILVPDFSGYENAKVITDANITGTMPFWVKGVIEE